MTDRREQVQRVAKRAQAFKALFLRDDGTGLNQPARVVMSHLRRYCHVTQPVHKPGDPYSTAFADGRRDVYLQIMRLVNLDESVLWNLTDDDIGG